MSRAAFLVVKPDGAALRALNYDPTVERLRVAARGKDFTLLRDLAAELGSGYATVFARIDCERSFGVELLSQGDMFAAEPRGRVIRRDSMQRPERHEIRRWDVLVAGAGTLAPTELYGRAIVADSRLAGLYVGQDTLLIRMKVPESDEALFAYAYLASEVGLRALRSTSYGTKILRIRKDILGALPVPMPSLGARAEVAALVRASVEQRERYAQELQRVLACLIAADERFGDTGGMYGRAAWRCRISPTTIAARNHRPALQAFAEGVTLRDVLVDGQPRKAGRFARVQCNPEFGTPFLGQRDLFLIRPIPQHIRTPSSSEGLAAETGTIILAAAGQSGESTIFGRSELGDFFAGSLVSEHTLHLCVDGRLMDHRYLFAVLHSPWGIAALKACATGTSVPSLDPTLLSNIRIPRLKPQQEAEIAERVRDAYAARKAASAAEEAAFRRVEEVVQTWLV